MDAHGDTPKRSLKTWNKRQGKIYQYILKASWEYVKQIAQILPTKKYQGKHQQAYAEYIANPYYTLSELTGLFNEVSGDDSVWNRYRMAIREGFKTLAEERKKIGDEKDLIEPDAAIKYLDRFEEIFHSVTRKLGIEPFWHKTPEEILGLREALPAPYVSYREWLVKFLSSILRSMDLRELAELIVSCCGGECIYKGLTRHRKG